MTLTQRKRRSDAGVKRGSASERKQAKEALLHLGREEEARKLAALSNDELRALLLRLEPGKTNGLHVFAHGAPGLVEVYCIDLVAKEVLSRRWPRDGLG